jgi:hypothetical protein
MLVTRGPAAVVRAKGAEPAVPDPPTRDSLTDTVAGFAGVPADVGGLVMTRWSVVAFT